MKKPVYIIEAKRTAVGKYGGSLSQLSAIELGIFVVQDLISRYPFLKLHTDEVVVGNVLAAGLGQNPAREVAVKAGISVKTPAFTINQVCGSGLKSVAIGLQLIQSQEAHIVIAGGLENMSRVPYYLDNHRFGCRLGNHQVRDGVIVDGLFCSIVGEHMGVTAENLAKKFHISRESQDQYSVESHKRAIKAINHGLFKDEIVPVQINIQKHLTIFETDEQPRPDCTMEKLQQLKPVFAQNGTVTAGNSCSLNDGASMILLASEQAVKRYHLHPKVVIKEYATVGLKPKYMGLGSYYAARDCLMKSGLTVNDIDLWEINEAFASQMIVVVKLLRINSEKVNINGGAIALGHPIGASGARILTTLVHELVRSKKNKYGVASLCIGGGQGIAALIERI
jgi:acetyl-CoA C-acetyltransferase